MRKKNRLGPSGGVWRKAGFALKKTWGRSRNCSSQDHCLMKTLPHILSASLQAQQVGAVCKPKGIWIMVLQSE